MKFFRAAKGHITIPLLLVSLVLMQAAQVLGSYWLVFWQEDQFNKPQGCTSLLLPSLLDSRSSVVPVYMGIYAGLGILQALFSFLMGTSFLLPPPLVSR